MHLMLDLETLGTRESAIVLTIGAVPFDFDGTIGEPLTLRLAAAEQEAIGRTVDASTVLWWMKQPIPARHALQGTAEPLADALAAFTGFVREVRPVGVWGCGADFDCVLVRSLYLSAGLRCPFDFRSFRCYRTLKALRPDVAPGRAAHVAAEDAVIQARHAIVIGQALGLAEPAATH